MLRISEIFQSIQGEGLYTGVPSLFIRLFGCNFTCPGFFNEGRIDRKYTVPVNLSSLKDLDGNMFTTGCDTKYAWDPAFKCLVQNMEAPLLVREVSLHNVNHIVITGGEPLMQAYSLADFIKLLSITCVGKTLTIESNASISIPETLYTALVGWMLKGNYLLFSNSPKLSNSGEEEKRRLKFSAIDRLFSIYYENINYCDITFKYVVKNELDVLEAIETHRYLIQSQLSEINSSKYIKNKDNLLIPILMPMGGTVEQYNETLPIIADLAIRYKCRLSPRLHLNCWGNKIGT